MAYPHEAGWRNCDWHLKYLRCQLPPNYPVPAITNEDLYTLAEIAAYPSPKEYAASDFFDIGRRGLIY